MNKYPTYTYSFKLPASSSHTYNTFKEISICVHTITAPFSPAGQSLPLCFFQMTKVLISHILTSPLIHLLGSESLIIQDS